MPIQYLCTTFLAFVLVVSASAQLDPGSYWLQSAGLRSWEWDVDHDHDNRTAREEYAAGTNPFDPDSKFDVDWNLSSSTEELMLTWPSVLGAEYEMFHTPSLENGFMSLAPFSGDGQEMEVAYSTEGQMRHFYRLDVKNPIDADGDGLSAIEEVMLGTNPAVANTDGDMFDDGEEVVIYFTDPLVPNVPGGTIRGTLWSDPNADSDLTDGSPINEATIYLDANFNGMKDPSERTSVTDASGNYEFLFVQPGVHHVRQELPAPNVQTFPVDAIAPIYNMLPDEVTNYTHSAAGVGDFDLPYGENASDWPAGWGDIDIGPTVELVPSVDLVLKPLGVRNEVPGVLTYNGTEFLDLPLGAHITVRFDELIVNGPGADLLIHSITTAAASPEEIEVLVGATEASLTSLGIFSQGLSTIAIDLNDHDIPGPIQYVKCISQNNEGGWKGFELVGMEAINIAPQDPSTHLVIITSSETVEDKDFGRHFRDLPPTLILSASDNIPTTTGARVGESVTAKISAFDDIGIASLTLKANGQSVSLNADNEAVISLTNPGSLLLEASATDSGGQTETKSSQLYVINADGTFPFDPNQIGLNASSSSGAPSVRILTPGAGTVSSSDVDLIADIIGEPAVTSWTVEYAPVDDIDPYNLATVDADYVQIASGTGNVFSDVIATMPLATLADGIYFVRVSAQNSPTQTAYFGQVLAKNVLEADLRPQVVIESPASGANVTMTVDIEGTITSTRALREWYVEYALADLIDLNNINADDADWKRLASGTDTIDTASVITNFDGTLLKNNGYVIRVVAWNDIGLGWAEPLVVDVTGEAKLGRNRIEVDDLAIDLAGFPLQFTRVYDSYQADEDGELGYGWSIKLQDPDIRETVPDTGVAGLFGSTPFRDGTRVYINAPTGERLGFTFKPVVAGASAFGPTYKATFVPDPGVYHTLEIPEGDLGFLQLEASGEVFLFFFKFPYNPEKYVLIEPNGNRFTYHEDKGFLQAEDPNGNTITLNNAGIDHSNGIGLTFTRDGQGRITGVTDPDGNQWTYTYTTEGELETVTDPDSRTTTYSYLSSPAHYLDTITDSAGRMPRKYEYDPVSGRLAAVIDENGNRRENTVDPQGFSGTRKNARGHVTTFEYDVRGNVTRETDPKGNVTQYQYNDPANPDRETCLIDANGECWDYVYNSLGQVTSLSPPLATFGNNRFVLEYDDFGNVTSYRDEKGRTSTFTYDANGNRTSEAPFHGLDLTFNRADDGRLTERVLSSDYAIQYTYDANGFPASETDSIGRTVATSYLSNGRLETVTDASGTLDVAFTSGGELNTQDDPNGNTATLVENADGSLTRTDRVGNVSTSLIDADGRLTDIDLPGGGTVDITYDADGNLETITDPLANVTTYAADTTNLVTSMMDAAGNARSYDHDAFGNITEIIDRNGKRRTFVYDKNRRLTHERWHDGTGAIVREIIFTHNPLRGLQRVEDTVGSATQVHTFGQMPRPTENSVEYPGQQAWRVTYTWGGNGSATAPRGVQIRRGFEVARAEINATYHGGELGGLGWSTPNGGGKFIQILRNLDGTISREVRTVGFGNQHSETLYTYDSLKQLASVRHEDGSGNLVHANAALTYTRDAESRLTGIAHAGNTSALTYGSEGQLLSATHTAATYTNESYTYDIAGNRTGSHLTAGPAVIAAPNRITAIGSLAFLYDLEGNITRRTQTTSGVVTNFEYDHRNRLVLATVHPSLGAAATTTVRFSYDFMDRLASREINGSKTWIVYDRDMPLGEFADGETDLNAAFLYSLDQTDHFHAVWRAGQDEQWFLKDQLGSIRGILNSTGTIQSWVDYDSFGNLQPGNTPANGERLGYAGRFHLPELGLYENRRRFYDPQLGRFTQEDPIRFSGADFNYYRYAYNHPTGLKDPTGTVTAANFANVVRILNRVKKTGDKAKSIAGELKRPCQIASWSAGNFGLIAGLEPVLNNPSAFGGGAAPSIQPVDLSGETGCGG